MISFIFQNGAWVDYQWAAPENAAGRPEYAAAEATGIKMYFDNFPIKGYCNYIAGDMTMVPEVLSGIPPVLFSKSYIFNDSG